MFSATDSFKFIRFLCLVFPCVLPYFRRFEKCSYQAYLQKERITFLRKCLAEKVVPRSLKWVYRACPNDPFPECARLALSNAIVEAKSQCEFYFFQLRKSRRDLRSAIPSPSLIHDIEQSIRFLTGKKITAQRSRLSALVDRLCFESIWSKFSCPENIINLSNYCLKRYETEILGFGLNFALPANRHHFPLFFRNLNFQNHSRQNDYLSSVFGSIYNDLASFSQSLPKRYYDALLSLKHNNSIKVCPADKGGKIVILNSCDYVNKLSVLFSDSSTYKPIPSNPLSKMQSA